MDEKTIAYLAASALVVAVVVVDSSAFGLVGVLILLLAVIASLLIILLAFADYIVFPIFTRLLDINVIPAKDYMIPKTQDCVIKYSNGVYYATGYLTANIYGYIFSQEKATEDDAEMAAAPEKWEKAIMNIRFPFKFNMVAAAEDVQRYRDELEGKRGLLEFQYSKESSATNPNPMNLADIQRQMNVVQARIDRIGLGERPVNNIMYIESTGVGVSEKEASDNLTNQLNELQTIFNIFDLSIFRVVGRELYHLFNLNYIIPGMNELTSEFQVQR